jgi:subtilisin family serine protease
VTYTFSVVARTAIGYSPVSTSSNAIIPVAGGIPPVAAASWGLDRTDQRALPLDSLISRGGNGVGVTAYVIDTGVYTSHTQFTGRMGAGFSAVSDNNGTNDCNGHGTHVAGTIAGSTYGFATMATVIPVRVLDCSGAGSTSGVVSGINWIINHHVAGVPAVANMSLGGGYDIALNDAVTRAVADGITFVVAAGNSSTDACTTSPASAPAAITVGATGSTDALAYYSNIGACVDILAPGSAIVSAGISSASAAATMSGTSMASPHVAGVAAVILGNNRSFTPAQVAGALGSDATRGAITGVGTATVNALLYEAPATTSSFNFFDDSNVDNGSYDNGSDYSEIDYGNDPGVLPDPSRPRIVTPKDDGSSNGSVSATPISHSPNKKASVAVKSVARVGKNYRVTVAAPTGALITLYRNGKKVAMSKNSRFLIPVGKISGSRFHAVITVSGARVVSNTVSYVVHAASRR